MRIKPFDGEFNEYKNFRNSFLRLSNDYQTHEKFEYLRSKLAGKALKTIEHLENIDANYDKAWVLLDKKFFNERFQLESNLNKLHFEIPSARYDSIQSVESLAQAAIGIHANLEALHVEWRDLFTFHIIQRLDTRLRAEFYKTLEAGKIASDLKLFEFFDNIQQTFSANLAPRTYEGQARPRRNEENPGNGVQQGKGRKIEC